MNFHGIYRSILATSLYSRWEGSYSSNVILLEEFPPDIMEFRMLIPSGQLVYPAVLLYKISIRDDGRHGCQRYQ
jgi:hypothetical protein